MKITLKYLFALLLSGAIPAAVLAQRESEKTYAVYSRGIKAGMGIAHVQSEQGLSYQNGPVFNAGLFSSFGWRGIVQLQPEAGIIARSFQGRDELLLFGIPSGFMRDLSFEISELQFGLLLKIGSPSWTDAPQSKNKRVKLQQKRNLPYISGGALLSHLLEGKRIIRLDSPGSIPKSGPWLNSDKLRLDWVAAIGYEWMRHHGGGLGVEARWQLRDLPLDTGLGDSVKLSSYTLSVFLLF